MSIAVSAVISSKPNRLTGLNQKVSGQAQGLSNPLPQIMKESHHGYERMLKLWFNQEGQCPQCGERITRETGWNLHHRIRLVDGGDDSLTNLALMHPTCHQQLHAQTDKQTVKVVNPRPP